MNREAIERLGVKIRPYSESTFIEFIGASDGKALFLKADHQLSRHGIERSSVRVQVSLRPDLWNGIQFLVSAPHGPASSRRVGYLCLIYPDRHSTMERDNWQELAQGWAAPHYWEHLEELEAEGAA